MRKITATTSCTLLLFRRKLVSGMEISTDDSFRVAHLSNALTDVFITFPDDDVRAVFYPAIGMVPRYVVLFIEIDARSARNLLECIPQYLSLVGGQTRPQIYRLMSSSVTINLQCFETFATFECMLFLLPVKAGSFT